MVCQLAVETPAAILVLQHQNLAGDTSDTSLRTPTSGVRLSPSGKDMSSGGMPLRTSMLAGVSPGEGCPPPFPDNLCCVRFYDDLICDPNETPFIRKLSSRTSLSQVLGQQWKLPLVDKRDGWKVRAATPVWFSNIQQYRTLHEAK